MYFSVPSTWLNIEQLCNIHLWNRPFTAADRPAASLAQTARKMHLFSLGYISPMHLALLCLGAFVQAAPAAQDTLSLFDSCSFFSPLLKLTYSRKASLCEPLPRGAPALCSAVSPHPTVYCTMLFVSPLLWGQRVSHALLDISMSTMS